MAKVKDEVLEAQIKAAAKLEHDTEFAWRAAVDELVVAREKADAAKKANMEAMREHIRLLRLRVDDDDR